MKGIRGIVTTIVCLLAFSAEAKPAAFGLAGSSGAGVANLTPYRLALLWDLGPVAFKERAWELHSVWEASAGYWNSERVEGLYGSQGSIFSTGPQFRLERVQLYTGGLRPYWEAGIGASWLSKTTVVGRTVGIHYQFEDRFGFGTRFGHKQHYDANVRVIHYSNAHLSSSNSGVNIGLVTVGYWL